MTKDLGIAEKVAKVSQTHLENTIMSRFAIRDWI